MMQLKMFPSDIKLKFKNIVKNQNKLFKLKWCNYLKDPALTVKKMFNKKCSIFYSL